MADTNDDLIIRMIEQLRTDFAEERESARESRARTHTRVDEIVERLGKIDTSIAIAGQVDAQVRVELDALSASLKLAQPTIDEWNRVRTIGKWAIGVLLAGGIGTGAVVAWLSDSVVTTIRHWLRIN